MFSHIADISRYQEDPNKANLKLLQHTLTSAGDTVDCIIAALHELGGALYLPAIHLMVARHCLEDMPRKAKFSPTTNSLHLSNQSLPFQAITNSCNQLPLSTKRYLHQYQKPFCYSLDFTFSYFISEQTRNQKKFSSTHRLQ